ncbi:MAG: short-chain dehydrogenase [Chloroflexi bacterium]|nr:short-chain dehydrogenase [Chloroflexota bacterium]
MNPKNKVTCIITGATSGIGLESAIQLATRGFFIIGIGRNDDRCIRAFQKVKQHTEFRDPVFLNCDLSDQKQIKDLSEIICDYTDRVDVMINNAAGIFLTRKLDAQGIEMSWSVNYLSHFLLTGLLLKKLKNWNNSKIINLSSIAHENSSINFSDVSFEENFNGMKSYRQSKLAMLMWTYILADKLNKSGTSVNAVHPGIIRTRLLSNNGVFSPLLNFGLKIVGKNVTKGASNVARIADIPDDKNISGKYFYESKIQESSLNSMDKKNQIRLWLLSEQMSGFKY